MQYYLKALQEYATFTGRATRKEYWMFVLFNTIAYIVLAIVARYIPAVGILSAIYQLGVMIPYIALGIRRVHDVNYVGWWILFPFFNLYLFCKKSDSGANRFGPPPLALTATN